MKGYPASRVQEQAKIKAGWYAEIVPIDLHTQVVKAQPGKNADHDICNDVPSDMYSWLVQS